MNQITHKGPHPGMLAIIFAGLFITGLSFVVSFTEGSHFPGPWDGVANLEQYFPAHAGDVL